MKFEIDDNKLRSLITMSVNNMIQSKVSEIVKSFDIKGLANQRMTDTFNRECRNIINDGRFYNAIAKRLAMELASDILEKLDMDKVMLLTAIELSKELCKKMAK